jgi:hypothetical protein
LIVRPLPPRLRRALAKSSVALTVWLAAVASAATLQAQDADVAVSTGPDSDIGSSRLRQLRLDVSPVELLNTADAPLRPGANSVTAFSARSASQGSVGPPQRLGTNVRAAFFESLKLLTFEHGIRIGFQEKTRRELGGPFWSDYKKSVRVPKQWDDTDSVFINYIGHPIHGAAAGYAWIDNGPEVSREIEWSGAYWAGRARTLAWTAGYSLQFELGPLSEASIGNVGMDPATTGWVDHVVTPIGAFGLIVAEDALDRFFVKWLEAHTSNRFLRATMRLGFNPARTMSNVARGRVPWHREGRPIGWQR